MNLNSLFLTLYTPLWRRRGADLSPEEVWVEGNRLATLLRIDSDVDVQIKVEQAFDDLCINYEVFIAEGGSQVRRSQQQASHSAMMVMLTAFLLLLNVYDKAEDHPYKEILIHMKTAIWDVTDCKQLYEDIRNSEDEREKQGKFIEVADFIEEIAAQEEPLSKLQKEFACKRMEEFLIENKYSNLSTKLDNEWALSRVNDKNDNCFQSELNLLRAEIDAARNQKSAIIFVDEIDDEMLVCAIENSQELFWASSAYAVVFCVCRDDLNMMPNKSAFERKIMNLKYNKKLSFTCKNGTIANAFSDNPIYYDNVNDWKNFNAAPRIIKLRDKLRNEIKL